MRTLRTMTWLLLVLFLVSGCDLSVASFLAWDQDGDEQLDRREVAVGVLDHLDTDASRTVEPREVHVALEDIGLFRVWDEDGDMIISKLELQFLLPDTGAMVGDPARQMVEDWDQNDNGRLEYWEVSTGLHSRWDYDTDESLSLEEVDSAVHGLAVVASADKDEDGKISFLEATNLVARREVVE